MVTPAAGMLAVLTALMLAQPASAADNGRLADGWHSWETPAGSSGRQACCHDVRGGFVTTTTCRLGSGRERYTIQGDCNAPSDALRVYVLVADGHVAAIRALSATCPVTTTTPVQAGPARDATESIAWLERHARGDSRLAEQAVTAIALHADANALVTLKAFVEDPSRGMEVRRQALFWLAQSEDEAAFRYLDGLLSQR